MSAWHSIANDEWPDRTKIMLSLLRGVTSGHVAGVAEIKLVGNHRARNDKIGQCTNGDMVTIGFDAIKPKFGNSTRSFDAISAYAQIISHATMDRHDVIHDVTMTS